MIKIVKGNQPNSMIAHKKSGGNYGNMPTATKNELRESLINEQGYVCCYCLKRIPENKADLHHTKIEHFKCQENYAVLDLEYTNLHLACKGNEGQSEKLQTCDTAKANKDIISFSLIDNSLNGNIHYAKDGTVFSEQDNIEKEINEILQLNNDQNIKKTRASILKGVSESIRILQSKGRLTKNVLERELQYWQDRNNNKHRPFYPVAVQYLEKKIEKFN
ncbi:retron system putative HNH endonuclease [Mesoflavibacter sp.]|uniref:retron system putative HNH endonuclease n=1 Tax=Mesoflavibacter sp. TaxID=1930902 RepID=UPI0035593EF1